MAKIKLLFDVKQLSENGLKGTGIVRVTDVLLRKLAESEEIDVYPVITDKHGDFNAYLRARGMEDMFKDKIVRMLWLRKTFNNKSLYKKLRAHLYSKWYALKYRNELKKYDAYFSPFDPIAPTIYQSRMKTFYIIHDLIPYFYPYDCEQKFIDKFIYWIKKCQADAYFCVSAYTVADFVKFRPEIAEKPKYVMYLGADKTKFHPVTDKQEIAAVKAKYGIKTAKYFLAVSEITARKNLVHLLKAFAEFLQQSKAEDIALVLAGPERKGYTEVAAQAEELAGRQNQIVQTGFVDDADLAALYSGATAFIYPSLYEGFGLPVLEAMQCGAPVITCDNSSLPEVGGEAVLYVSGHDVEQTAAKLRELYQNEALGAELRQKGLAQAQKFDWQKTADTLMQAIIKEVRK